MNVLEKEDVTVDVGPDRDRLMAIKRGEVSFEDADAWRIELQKKLTTAFDNTDLPERPNYERANELLIKARRLAMSNDLP